MNLECILYIHTFGARIPFHLVLNNFCSGRFFVGSLKCLSEKAPNRVLFVL